MDEGFAIEAQALAQVLDDGFRHRRRIDGQNVLMKLHRLFNPCRTVALAIDRLLGRAHSGTDAGDIRHGAGLIGTIRPQAPLLRCRTPYDER